MPLTNGFSELMANPLVLSPFTTDGTTLESILPPPPPGSFIITESGDLTITEDGNYMITE
jgi:hypothetical protein